MSPRTHRLIAERWKFVPIVMLLSGVLSAYTMVTLSMGDGNASAVEPDYYRKGAAWDETKRQVAANGVLHWIVTPAFVAALGDARCARLEVAVADKYAVAIEDAVVHAEIIPMRAADARCTLELMSMGRGRYGSDVPLRVGGVWEVRLRIESKGRLYTDRIRRQIHFATPPAREASP